MDDKETQEKKDDDVLKKETDELERKGMFANSDEWRMVKDSLIRKLMELDSVSHVVEKEKALPLSEIKEILYINGKVVNIVVSWLNEVEGYGAAYKAGEGVAGEMAEKKKGEIIVRL
jgi:hypothetical protein